MEKENTNTPKKVELVWEGKKADIERVALPFQRIEIVNESRATREAQKDSFLKQFDKNETEWRNKLIWGDNKYVLSSLLDHFAGKVKLIYIDPPFASGQDFSFDVEIGELEIHKDASLIEEKAYRDTWGKGLTSYLEMMYQRLVLMRELLTLDGSIYVHCDWRVNSSMRLIMDEIFGEGNFRNEIYAKRKTKNLQNQFDQVTRLNIAFDSVLWYSRTPESRFRPPTKPAGETNEDQWNNFWNNADRPTLRYPLLGIHLKDGQWRWTKEKAEEAVKNYEEFEKNHSNNMTLYKYWIKTGKRKRFIRRPKDSTRCYYWVEPKDEIAVDTNWFDIYAYDNSPNVYPTQKSEPFINRIIEASSEPGDIVLDAFSGGGTTVAVSEKKLRNWIACDLSRWSIQCIRKRLLDIENCRPFEVLNLGKYERQYWQGITFSKKKDSNQTPLHEYVKFILDLYKAEPITGMVHIHGQRGGRMVHVGAVDAPVTLSEMRDAIDECAKIKQSKLDILGWEWEMGLHDVEEAEAKKSGINLRLIHIPREAMDPRAIEAGDIHFYELAYLEVEPEIKGRCVRLKLKNFVISSPELIPAEVRSKIKKWSDYIDYWAIDYEFKDDVFHNQWQDYRTRVKRDLELVSDWHDYETPGERRILIKVFDIFGNDTTHMLELKLR